MKKNNSLILLFGLSGWLFILSLFFIWEVRQREAPGIIDTQAVVAIEAQKIVSLYPKGDIPPEKLQQLVEQLKSKVEAFAKSQNITLFAKGAVWGGSLPDYTDLVIESLKED